MISAENLAQLRALIESILDEKLAKYEIRPRSKQDISEKRRRAARVRWEAQREINRLAEVGAKVESAAKHDAHALQPASPRKPLNGNGSHAHAMQMHAIGDGEIICVVHGLRGPVEVRQSYVRELMEAYPGVMVAQEIERARIWCDDNPTKRKLNVRRFLTGWVRRKQG